ncbi:MAG TPA: hypothetical protein VGO39_14145 [Gaiellaceae bacterium]|nr:hypothetical protein [Gaiellaceae bacterium]
MIRAGAALVLLVAAAFLAAVAVDAGRWQDGHGERPKTLAGGVAERVLGAGSDVALRRAVRRFVAAEQVPYGFDNGQAQARARAIAQAQLSDVAAAAPPRAASQADDLLGVLAWGSTRAPTGVVDPADRAVNAFTDASRLDPANVDAEFNLELALRSLLSTGVRHGPSPSSGPRGTGHSGAGAGTPGQGY